MKYTVGSASALFFVTSIVMGSAFAMIPSKDLETNFPADMGISTQQLIDIERGFGVSPLPESVPSTEQQQQKLQDLQRLVAKHFI